MKSFRLGWTQNFWEFKYDICYVLMSPKWHHTLWIWVFVSFVSLGMHFYSIPMTNVKEQSNCEQAFQACCILACPGTETMHLHTLFFNCWSLVCCQGTTWETDSPVCKHIYYLVHHIWIPGIAAVIHRQCMNFDHVLISIGEHRSHPTIKKCIS